MTKRSVLSCAITLAIAATSSAQAYELYQDDARYLNLDVSAAFGLFHSQRSYAAVNPETKEQSTSWREGYLKYGFSAGQKLVDDSELSAGLAWVSSGTWGNSDAAGLTDGSERHTRIEEGWARWKSGQLISALGENGLDISAGRQFASVGSGFLIHGDPVNMGNQIADGVLDRGGAYYLAPRNNFARTGIIRLGGETGWRGDLMYLKSENKAQAKTALHVANLEHVGAMGTIGATYIKGKDVDKEYADEFQLERKGMKVYSLRGNSSFGVDNLDLSAEYARQKKRSGDTENAWFTQASWTFADTPWQPTATYRYSRFSKGFDPLFYGLSTGFGTWFQGEVAANYAGPFNSNTKVHHVGVTAQPREDLTLGALAFKFNTLDKKQGDLSGSEFDIYAQWDVNQHLSIIPVMGLYKPKKDVSQGGAQLKDNKRNLYSQLLFMTQF